MKTTNRLCESRSTASQEEDAFTRDKSKSPATHKATAAAAQPHRQWKRKELDTVGVKDHDDHEEEGISCILGGEDYVRLSDDPLGISWHHHD